MLQQDTTVRKTPLILPGKTRPSATLRGNTVEVSKSVGKGHFLTRPPAIALHEMTAYQARQNGGEWVEITERDSGLVLRGPLAKFTRAIDLGFGKQRACLLAEMEIVRGDQDQITALLAALEKRGASSVSKLRERWITSQMQPSLFEAAGVEA